MQLNSTENCKRDSKSLHTSKKDTITTTTTTTTTLSASRKKPKPINGEDQSGVEFAADASRRKITTTSGSSDRRHLPNGPKLITDNDRWNGFNNGGGGKSTRQSLYSAEDDEEDDDNDDDELSSGGDTSAQKGADVSVASWHKNSRLLPGETHAAGVMRRTTTSATRYEPMLRRPTLAVVGEVPSDDALGGTGWKRSMNNGDMVPASSLSASVHLRPVFCYYLHASILPCIFLLCIPFALPSVKSIVLSCILS